MAGDAIQLGDDDPHGFYLVVHLDAHQLLNSQSVTQAVIHGSNVVHAVGVRNHPGIVHVLRMLFETAMEIPDVRSDLLYHLAVRLELQSQHTMRAGMLRPHVEDHLLAFEGFDLHKSP
jgi:hypothetical protein